MPTERTPHNRPQEQRDYAGFAQDLRERLQSGLLSELTPYPQFVVWKYTVENKKLKKRPFNPRTHTAARTNDPTTWASVEPSLKALATGRYNGIGFVFSEADPFTGTDLDACVAKDGSIAPWAKEIITSLSSYTEYSPSKLGVHILTRATLPGAGKKVGSIEQYSQGRFFTLTTDQVPGTPRTIADRQAQQERLYTSLGERAPQQRSENTSSLSERTQSGHVSGHATERVLPGTGKNDLLLFRHRQNRGRKGSPMTWKEISVPVLGPG